MSDLPLFLHAEAISGIGAWSLDDRRTLAWTPQTFRLHGLPPDARQPTADEALALLAPADREHLAQAWAHALAGRGGFELHHTVQRADGVQQRLRCRAEWQDGAVPRLVGTLEAATEAQAPAESLPLGRDPLSLAVAGAGVGVWEMDLHTGEEHWSDLTLAIYGLPPGSAAPTRDRWRREFLHPDDLPHVLARAAELQQSGRHYEMDYRIRRAGDGAVRWLHTRATFADAVGRRVIGVTLDITVRRAAEERAREAARQLDLAATYVGFGSGYRELGGGAGTWSPQLKHLFGLPPDAPTPDRETLAALISDRDRERVMAQLGTALEPDGVRQLEFDLRPDAQGRARTLMTRAITVHDDPARPARLYFAVVDVTDLRRQDRQVANLLERLQLAAEASGIGTWEHDDVRQETRWEASTLALFGLPADAPAPDFQQFLQLLHPDDRERVRQEWARVLASARSIDVEFRVPQPDGRVRWVRTRGRVERGPDGTALRRQGVCFDTTERREAEAAVQARELAEQANAAKTEFLSRMSHELRTPLNAVLGFAQLLGMDGSGALNPTQRTRVEHIQNAGWHLLALVNDVLDLAKIESRQALMACTAVPLAEVMQECLAMTAALADPAGIVVHALPASELPPQVWADRTRLRQVLLNLLSNAVKYNRPGGRVNVQARLLADGRVEIEVADTGQGLTADQMAHLFEPFNRLGRERSGIEGTGIGLTLSKLIVEQMGGHMTVSSEPDVGTQLRLVLPGSAPARV